jgi:glycosyltransferase involved in cell wall biosynthesis
MTIGVAIPTFSGHIHKLPRLLDWLDDSTVRPSQVSVSVSSCCQLELKRAYRFELIVSLSSHYKNPAQNRNLAASRLDTDIISFMDGDDLPHPQRNEFVLEAFRKDAIAALVHNYHFAKLRPLGKISKRALLGTFKYLFAGKQWMEIPIQELHLPTGVLEKRFLKTRYAKATVTLGSIGLISNYHPFPVNSASTQPYHCAHISLKRDLFNQFKFDEREDLKYREDSSFCKRLVEGGNKLSHIGEKLSLYLK